MSAVFVLVGFAGCSLSGPKFDPEIQPGVFQFDFESGETSRQGWEPIFVGIPSESDAVETESSHRSLPGEVEKEGHALFIRGFNPNGPGMGLFFRRRIQGLNPNTSYRVSFEVEIATNIPDNCPSAAGGSSSLTRVVAASLPQRPTRVAQEHVILFDEATRKALDLGAPHSKPPHLGTASNGISCENAHSMGRPYRLKTLESKTGHWTVTADEGGGVWLLVGSVTAAPSRVRLYYNEITARFEEVKSSQ